MHWLQSLDTALFHFINGTLSNPFFDWLMPLLSGGHGAMQWFVPVVALSVMAAVFFGNARTRLCVIMMVMVVALGDPLILNTIKHAVARPRPCIALTHVVERLGCTHSGSMPSAHAGNWFAVTMILFLFYRRKLWIFLPTLAMAIAVSFSRVYNGVHYPGDVLAGAIFGAGYAAGLVIGLQMLWDWIGKRWFPVWYEKNPSLLKTSLPARSSGAAAAGEEAGTAPSKPSIVNHQSSIQWLRLGYFIIAIALVARWVYISTPIIELSQDEAYQWVWSKHLALSYYSKPLGIAVIQFVGTHLFGDTQFGVRFFSPLFAAILSVILLRFFAREVGARSSFWLLLVGMTTPLLGVGSILMTIDPPLVLCWTWAMIAGWRALQPDGKIRDWLVVGLAMGLGFLCKYTAAYLIVCFGIFFALQPSARIHLRKPGPWLGLLIFCLCTLPVIIWNSQHGWITVHHVAGNAGIGSQWKIRTLDFVLDEFGLMNPFFFVGAVWAMFAFWKFRRDCPLWVYFFCMGAPVFIGHFLWSFHSRILPNWIAPAILPMFCLMVAYWDKRFHEGRRFVKPLFTIGLVLGGLAIAILYQSHLVSKISGNHLPGEMDPLRRVRGWDVEAKLAETEREKMQQQQNRPAFILCSHYGITGLYSFYIPQARKDMENGRPLVYSMDSNEPKNQFYFWPEYDYHTTRKGENAVFVTEASLYKYKKDWFLKWLAHEPIAKTTPEPRTLPPRIASEFQSVTDLGEQDIMIGDRVYHRVHLWACYNLK